MTARENPEEAERYTPFPGVDPVTGVQTDALGRVVDVQGACERTWATAPLAGDCAGLMRPGTIVELGNTVLRRRPAGTGGLPWKCSRTGARCGHAEVDALIAQGAKVSMCETCTAGQACVPHDMVGAGAVAAEVARRG